MKNILSTWICLDDESNSSYFPSSKGFSSDKKTQDIYWRCLVSCMFTARKFNPSLTLAIFSNTDKLPFIDGVDLSLIFKKLNIDFYSTPFEFQTPPGYYEGWKNQFYEFSIFKFISQNPNFDKNDNFCLIDSDCIINGNLDKMFDDINRNGSIEYKIEYSANQIINGNSRVDMKNIFSSLLNKEMDTVPYYYAGEYFGAKLSIIEEMMNEFEVLWPKLLSLHTQNLPRLHEEAHVLSYLYYKLNLENDIANIYIKRLWTDPTAYRNVQPEDANLLIWHLPAEKRNGFKKVFQLLTKINFNPEEINVEILQKKAAMIFSIPKISKFKNIYYFFKRLGKTMLKK